MRRVGDDAQRVAPDLAHGDALRRALGGLTHQCHVERVAAQRVELVAGEHLAQLHIHRWAGRTIGAQHVAEGRAVGQRRGEADAQPPELAARGAPDLVPRRFGVGQDLARTQQERMPRRGQADPPFGAMKQRRAQLFFQRANLHRQGWLRNVQALGRARKAERFGHGDEVT